MREWRRTQLFVSVATAGALVVACGAGLSDDPLAALGDGGTAAAATTSGSGATPPAGGATSGGGSGGSGGMTTALPEGATGSPDCAAGSDCSSGVCLQDVTGSARCCVADCRATGRVCSTSGACVCSGRTRDVGGECLLVEGQGCRTGTECASNHCADGVCCDAACDGVCERCDAPNQAGSCVLWGEDPSCAARTGFECTARGRCRLPLGLTCGPDADCESDYCEPAVSGEPICCEAPCNGVCQRCGASGACDAYPALDDGCADVACPTETACVSYDKPPAGQCASNGHCAECRPVYARTGAPCGPGEQCDVAGACQRTGVGRVAAGVRHTCAIRDNGNVVCWGDNSAGQLGAAFDHAIVGDDESPAAVTSLEIDFVRGVVALSAGFAHTCALFDDGRVRCWGRIENDILFGTVPGLLGTDVVVTNELGFVDPVATGDVRMPGPAVQISAGEAHSCALLVSGDIVCWGFNLDGQCGSGSIQEIRAPSNDPLPLVPLGAKALQVKAGRSHTCALLESGQVTCWGAGLHGRLGYGDATSRLRPVGTVPLGGRAIDVAVGLTHTCALLESGKVRCWGQNDFGQLGYGHDLSIGDDETPEQAASLPGPPGHTFLGGDVPAGGSNVVQLTLIADNRATCARYASGTVRCWGVNNLGQLGYGHVETLGAQYTPDQLVSRPAGTRSRAGGDIAFGGPVLALADGGRCALLVNGDLHCWGRNAGGELGLPLRFPEGSKTLTPVEMGPVLWQ